MTYYTSLKDKLQSCKRKKSSEFPFPADKRTLPLCKVDKKELLLAKSFVKKALKNQKRGAILYKCKVFRYKFRILLKCAEHHITQ